MIVSVAGGVLILAAAVDMFHSLFHPSGRGTLSRYAIRTVWIVMRTLARRAPRLLVAAGPTGFVAAVGTWAVMLVVGWALVYWPSLPEGFVLGPGLEPGDHGSFVDALYLSLVTLGTLGYGDIAPVDPTLRILAPLEALIGFVLLTASLAWVLSAYPALSRLRSLAEQVYILDAEAEGDPREMLSSLSPGEAARILSGLEAQVVHARADLSQHEIVYYFHTRDELHSLPQALCLLHALAGCGDAPELAPDVRTAARRLQRALTHLGNTIAADLLARPELSAGEAFVEYAAVHPMDDRVVVRRGPRP